MILSARSVNFTPMKQSIETKGYSFVEFASDNPEITQGLFQKLGFKKLGQKGAVTLYQQGGIFFFLNQDATSQAAHFREIHGSAAAAAGFFVENPQASYEEALRGGATAFIGDGRLFDLPYAIEGIGGSLVYLLDEKTFADLLQDKFGIARGENSGIGLQQIDHLSFNVKQGQLEGWADFYKNIFGFKEIRYFHIQGKQTALRSRALKSACGNMRITINESADDKSQIAEFIDAYKGEGIQHIALTPVDIYQTVESMRANGLPFVHVPDTYYEMLNERLPENGEDIERMRQNRILLDGVSENRELLLQIVTPPIFGPLFFEIIQRKGCDGFGEGNFTALFEALERDQVARGVLAA